MTEGRVGGGALQLVTVCLTDDGAGEVSDELGRPVAPAPPVRLASAPERGARARVRASGAGRAAPSADRRRRR